MNALLQLTDDSRFDADVKSAPTVLVAFSGTWCPPCRALEPTLAKLASERPDVRVLEIDVDANQLVAQRLLVRTVPTLFLFRQGRIVSQLIGNQPRARLDDWLAHAPH